MKRLILGVVLFLVPAACQAQESWRFSLFSAPDLAPYRIDFDGDEGIHMNSRVANWVKFDRSSEPWTIEYIFLVDWPTQDWHAEVGHGVAMPFWQFPDYILGRVDYTVYEPGVEPLQGTRWFAGLRVRVQ